MEFFLPIAEVYVSLPLIFLLSLVVGVLSGLFGVGGGYIPGVYVHTSNYWNNDACSGSHRN